MRLTTASFFKKPSELGGFARISIANSPPPNVATPMGTIKSLQPGREVVKAYKQSTKPQEEKELDYLRVYMPMVNGNIVQVVEELMKWLRYYGDVAMCCWEPPHVFCHRFVAYDMIEAGRYLERMGVEFVPEPGRTWGIRA